MGVNIFSLRLGEILMGLSAIYLIKELVEEVRRIKTISLIERLITTSIFLILLHFLYLMIINGYRYFDLYPFKTSSYIWVLGGYYLGKKLSYNFSSKFSIYSMFFALILSYFSSIFGITERYQDLILQFTDKFDYLKASDLLIFFVFFLHHALKANYVYSKYNINLLLIFSFFYLPLMLHKSRGASIAFLYIIAYLLFKYIKGKPKPINYLLVIVCSCIMFITSTFIVSKSPLELEEINEKIIKISTARYEKPVQNKPQAGGDYPFIYFEDSRIYSGDGNLNWRFQIWQDVLSDTKSKNLTLIGYGYNFKIPAMDYDFRSGNDGTNENVHNFFINIFARGGLIHLGLFIGLFILLLIKSIKSNKLSMYLLILIPALTTAFFDPAMENAHYPLIFYLLIGNATKD